MDRKELFNQSLKNITRSNYRVLLRLSKGDDGRHNLEERIRFLTIDSFGDDPEDMCHKLEITIKEFNSYTKIPPKICEKLVSYTGCNKHWFITGEGKPFEEESCDSILIKSSELSKTTNLLSLSQEHQEILDNFKEEIDKLLKTKKSDIELMMKKQSLTIQIIKIYRFLYEYAF